MKARFRPGWIPTLAAALAVATLCALGTWQLERLRWKQGLLADWNARIDLPPAPLEELLSDPDRFRYRRASALGRYETDHSILVMRVSRGIQDGAHVITPLRLEGSDTWVLVDRGWIPLASTAHFLEDDPAEGVADVTGLLFNLAETDARPGSAAARRIEWPRFDPSRAAQVAALQAQLPHPVERVLLQREQGPQGELPIGGFERPRSRVDHASYAITWYGMAAIAALVWVGFGLKQGRDGVVSS